MKGLKMLHLYSITDNRAEQAKINADFLLDLAGRIFKIPAVFNVDQGDYDMLLEISAQMDSFK